MLNTMPHFYKFTNDNAAGYGDLVFHDGLNVDPKPWTVHGAGALHFTTLADAGEHECDYTHVWDVQVPDDELLVNFTKGRGRAHSLILSNKRLKADILAGMPAADQRRALETFSHLAAFARIRGEALRAYAPELEWEHAGVSQYSNGLTVIRLPDGSPWRYTATTREDIGVGESNVLSVGQVAWFNEIRDGLIEGAVEVMLDSGMMWRGTYAHGVAHGTSVTTHKDGTKEEYMWDWGIDTPVHQNNDELEDEPEKEDEECEEDEECMCGVCVLTKAEKKKAKKTKKVKTEKKAEKKA